MPSVAMYSSSWATMGGGEKYLYTMAHTLAAIPSFEVTLVVDHPAADGETFGRLFGVDLEAIRFERVRGDIRGIRRSLAQSDVAVITANVWSLGHPASRTVYVMQIPYGRITPGAVYRTARHEGPREALKNAGRMFLLRDAARADAVIVYSEFVRRVLWRHHGIEAYVIHPAVEAGADGVAKKKAILAVGRFFHGPYNDKRHDVLIDAFKALYDSLENGDWELWLAGGCTDDANSRLHLANLRRRAGGYPIGFHVNCTHQELSRLYAEAALFWHAAGTGLNEDVAPERMEHFGMSTVEAMANGCVPLVVNRGGLREIVSHGISGCLWDSPGELIQQSRALITGSMALAPLQDAARRRAGDFSTEEFRRRMLELVQTLRL